VLNATEKAEQIKLQNELKRYFGLFNKNNDKYWDLNRNMARINRISSD